MPSYEIIVAEIVQRRYFVVADNPEAAEEMLMSGEKLLAFQELNADFDEVLSVEEVK